MTIETRAANAGKLLLVGEHKVYRAALKRLIETHSPHRVVADVATLEEAAAIVSGSSADVVFIDLDLQRASDMQLRELGEVIDACPLPVVVGCDGVANAAGEHRLPISRRATLVEKRGGWPAILDALNAVSSTSSQVGKPTSVPTDD